MTVETLTHAAPTMDFLRLTHLAAMAVGFGTMVSTDINTFRRVGLPITIEYYRSVESAHMIITPALLVAWLSGVGILWQKTGFDLSQFTPKLWAKLTVVSLLTLTALVVKVRVLPLLYRANGLTLMETAIGDKRTLAICAALSMAGWTMALCLGAIGWMKVAEPWMLVTLIGGFYAVALAVALALAYMLHERVRRTAQALDRLAFAPMVRR